MSTAHLEYKNVVFEKQGVVAMEQPIVSFQTEVRNASRVGYHILRLIFALCYLLLINITRIVTKL